MTLYAKFTCYPPLGQVAIVPDTSEEVVINVVLEMTKSWKDLNWEVALCYKRKSHQRSGRSKYSALPLHQSKATPQIIDHIPSTHYTAGWSGYNTYYGTLPAAVLNDGPVVFTVKYRIDTEAPWMSVDQIGGIPHGELIRQRSLDANALRPTHLKLDSGWKITPSSDVPTDANVFLIESTDYIDRGSGTAPISQRKALAIIENPLRFMAITRYSDMWIGPQQGDSIFDIWADAMMVCFLTENGHHITLVAMSNAHGVVNLLQSGDDGEIMVKSQNDSDVDARVQVIAVEALTIDDSIAAAMDEARKISIEKRNIKKVAENSDSIVSAELLSKNISETLEAWYDGLSYCTYNSLGLDLTFEKISKALDSFVTYNIDISTLIIDDNWQTVNDSDPNLWQLHRPWREFEANKQCFPNGLKSGIQELRQKHPRIKDIAVWHALLGYWGGLDPEGSLVEKYQTAKVPTQLIPHFARDVHMVQPSDIHRMYNDFYTFLSSCGVSAVKTDVQYMMDMFRSSPDRASFPEKYLSAWTTSHLRHFNGRAISCMSMTPQILFNYLSRSLPRVLLRNSDDYFPEIPLSHARHLFVNANNSLFTQHFNVLPDWDMFQTTHAFGKYHAAARCLSGGPVYITDEPTKHDLDLIQQMTATSVSGRTIALRPTNVGTSRSPYSSYTSGDVLQIGSYTGDAANGSGASLLGVFNIAEKPISFLLSPSDFPGIAKSNTTISSSSPPSNRPTHLIRSQIGARVLPPITYSLSRRTPDPRSLIFMALPPAGHDILTAHEIHTCTLPTDPSRRPGPPELHVAVLGLLGKLTGAAAVVASAVNVLEDARVQVNVELKALGLLGVWIGGDGNGVGGVGFEVTIEGQKVGQEWVRDSPEVTVDGGGRVIEVNVLGVLSMREWASKDGQASVEVLIVFG